MIPLSGRRTSVAIIAILTLTGCDRLGTSNPAATNAERTTETGRSNDGSAAGPPRSMQPPGARPGRTVVETGSGSREQWSEEDLTRALLELAAEYGAAPPNAEARSLLLEEMVAIGSSATLPLLRGLFEREADTDRKLEILAAAADVSKDHEGRLALLKSAIAEVQPLEVRAAGIDGLAGLRDPRVMPLLRRLQNDPDPKIQRLSRSAEKSFAADAAVASAPARTSGANR